MAAGLTSNRNAQTSRQIAAPATGPVSDATSSPVRPLVDTDIPAAIARDSEVTAAVAAEASARDAAIAAYAQPLDSDLTAIALLTTTAFGRGLLALAAAANLRTSAELATTDTPQFARLGIGVVAASSVPLTIDNGSAPVAIDAYADNGANQANIQATTFGVDGGGILHGRHAGGTMASPSQTLAGTITGGLGFRGWESGTNDFQASSPVSIHGVAKENQSSTARGSCLRMLTTALGAASRLIRAVFAADGDLIVGAVDSNPFSGVAGRGLVVVRESDVEMGMISAKGVTGFQCGQRFLCHAGTVASPGATVLGQAAFFSFGGHDGTNYASGQALIGMHAGSAFTPTSRESYLTFWTTPAAGASRVERVRFAASGSMLMGTQAALATTAVDGFLYIPTCAGTPTGVPTAVTGLVPMVVDTTNHKLYFYSGGAWRDAGP